LAPKDLHIDKLDGAPSKVIEKHLAPVSAINSKHLVNKFALSVLEKLWTKN